MPPSVNVDIWMARSHSGSLFSNNIQVHPQGVFFFPLHGEPFFTKAIWPYNDTFNALSASYNFLCTWSLCYAHFVSERRIISSEKICVMLEEACYSLVCLKFDILNEFLKWDSNYPFLNLPLMNCCMLI